MPIQSLHEDDPVICPRCAGVRIAVPWDASASDARKRILQIFFIIWATYPFWMLLSFFVRSPFIWMLPFMVYLVASFTLANDYFLHLRNYHCSSCGLRWKGGRHRR